MTNATLKERVFEAVKRIPVGYVSTYKGIAMEVGTKAYRAVGQILKKNPNAPEIPCHRVVKSTGEISGYFGNNSGNIETKIDLLEAEGVDVKKGKVDLSRHLYHFAGFEYAT